MSIGKEAAERRDRAAAIEHCRENIDKRPSYIANSRNSFDRGYICACQVILGILTTSDRMYEKRDKCKS